MKKVLIILGVILGLSFLCTTCAIVLGSFGFNQIMKVGKEAVQQAVIPACEEVHKAENGQQLDADRLSNALSTSYRGGIADELMAAFPKTLDCGTLAPTSFIDVFRDNKSLNVRVTNSVQSVQFSYPVDGDIVIITMIKEDNSWKINGIEINQEKRSHTGTATPSALYTPTTTVAPSKVATPSQEE